MTGEGEQTLRQKKSAATALNIEIQAVSLALEKGFDALTVDAICEASNVSQRTFFNYFGTKENAILGRFAPSVDEGKAREFLASKDPDIMNQILGLVVVTEEFQNNRDLELKRIEVLRRNPDLMGRQFERFSRVASEIEELIYLRFKRDATSGEPDFATRLEAKLASELVAVAFRVSMLGNPNAEMPGAKDHDFNMSELFQKVLERLSPKV